MKLLPLSVTVALVAKNTGLYEMSRTDRALSLAKVDACLSEKGLALDELAPLAKEPAGITYGDLLRNPCWDSLRDDSRFEKLAASLKPL